MGALEGPGPSALAFFFFPTLLFQVGSQVGLGGWTALLGKRSLVKVLPPFRLPLQLTRGWVGIFALLLAGVMPRAGPCIRRGRPGVCQSPASLGCPAVASPSGSRQARSGVMETVAAAPVPVLGASSDRRTILVPIWACGFLQGAGGLHGQPFQPQPCSCSRSQEPPAWLTHSDALSSFTQ